MDTDYISVGVRYFLGIVYVFIVFLSIWDVQRKKVAS